MLSILVMQFSRAVMLSGVKPVQIHGPDDRHPKVVFLIPKDVLRPFANSALV